MTTTAPRAAVLALLAVLAVPAAAQCEPPEDVETGNGSAQLFGTSVATHGDLAVVGGRWGRGR